MHSLIETTWGSLVLASVRASVLRRENCKSRDIEAFVGARHRETGKTKVGWRGAFLRARVMFERVASEQKFKGGDTRVSRYIDRTWNIHLSRSPFSFLRSPSGLCPFSRSRSSSTLGASQVPEYSFTPLSTLRPYSTRAPFTRATRVA